MGGCHHGRQAGVRSRSPPPLVREQRALELCGAQGRQVCWSREGGTDSSEDPPSPGREEGLVFLIYMQGGESQAPIRSYLL